MRNTFLIRLTRFWVELAHRLGRSFYWSFGEGRPTVLGLIIVSAATLTSPFIDIPHFWVVPTGFAALLFLFWVLKARRSIVIEEFADHTTRPGTAAGAATLLSIELARIGDLFRVVDERNALATAVGEGKPLEAAVKVDDPSDVLRSSVTAETKVTIGPVAIPIGTGMILLGRLVQGPRLRCQLHEASHRLVLTAQLTGLRRRTTWRIERKLELSSAEERAAQLDDMIPELACRMFTNLGPRRNVKWRAMRSFTDALDVYRSCLRTPQDRAVKLLKAQRHLVEALAQDEDFVLVYYNLGVVYNELARLATRAGKRPVADRHLRAAGVAFGKAVEQDPARWEPFYALARIYFGRGARSLAKELCERVVSLPQKRSGRVERAKAHDLIGHCHETVTTATITHRRRASKLALSALAAAALRRRVVGTEDDPLPTLGDLAANCIANLASTEFDYRNHDLPASQASPRVWSAWRRRAKFGRITALFEFAQSLTTKDANLHFELGRDAAEWHAFQLAVRELTAATRIEPERALFWAHLARAHRGAGGDDAAAEACVRAISAANVLEPSDDDGHALDAVLTTLDDLKQSRWSKQLRDKREFAGGERRDSEAELERGQGPGETEARIRRHLEAGEKWQAGHLSFVLGFHFLGLERDESDRHPELSEPYLWAAIKYLDEREVSRYNMRALLARALADQPDKRDAALVQAEYGVSLNPLSSAARDALGHVYNSAGDLEGARDAWSHALLLNPDEAGLHWELGFCCRRLGLDATDLADRRKILGDAVSHLKKAATLYPNERFEDRVRVQYWLARVYEELGELKHVIPSLRLVQTSPTMRTVADFLVGQAYRRLRDYNKAEALYESVIAATEGETAKIVGRKEVVEIWPFPSLCGRAKCALAMSNAERGGNFRRAHGVLAQVRASVDHLQALADEESLDCFERAEATKKRRELLAAYYHARGRLAMAEGSDLSTAIRELQRSITFRAHPEVYLDLAQAKWSNAANSSEVERLSVLEEARTCCMLGQATDPRSLCTKQVEALLEKLDAVRSGDSWPFPVAQVPQASAQPSAEEKA